MDAEIGQEAWGTFRRRVRERRLEMGWSQGDLAERLTALRMPVTNFSVAKIEAGTRRVDLAEAAIVAEVFGTSVGALVDDEGEAAAEERAWQRSLLALLGDVVAAREDYEMATSSLEEARAAVVSYLRDSYEAGAARPFLLGMQTDLHPDDLAAIEAASQPESVIVDLNVSADQRSTDR